MAQMNDIYLY